MRLEAQIRTTPKIAEYLENVNLTSVVGIVQKYEAGLLMPPQHKRKKIPIVVYGKGRDNAWGSKLHNDESSPGTKTTMHTTG